MSSLILHHYPNSPFAEKARLMLGFKGLAWTSVMIPSILPKPDVVALTGGYRRTPFLQIGADIYCDTALIADVLERLAPTPTLYPSESAGTARIVAEWADSTLFWTAIPYTMQPAGAAVMFAGVEPEAMKAFGADRAAMRANAPRMRLPEATGALQQYLERFEAQLADGRHGLLGAQLGIADFSVYHCLWFVRRGGPVAAIIDAFPHVVAWMARIAAIGHGNFDKVKSAAAVELAAASTPAAIPAPTADAPWVDLHGAPGTLVTVTPADYAFDPVAGELVLSAPNEVAVRRVDERAGEVVVHFPRIGYQISKPKSEERK